MNNFQKCTFLLNEFHFFKFQLNYTVFISESVKAVNPFIERIPFHDQDAFFDDYLNLVIKMHLALDDIHANSKTCRFLTPYKLMIAYARK